MLWQLRTRTSLPHTWTDPDGGWAAAGWAPIRNAVGMTAATPAARSPRRAMVLPRRSVLLRDHIMVNPSSGQNRARRSRPGASASASQTGLGASAYDRPGSKCFSAPSSYGAACEPVHPVVRTTHLTDHEPVTGTRPNGPKGTTW